MTAASSPHLFSPLQVKDILLRNRIAIAPMCQYAAVNGLVGDWHLVHLGARAAGGAGLVIAEGTAVSPEGRITTGCAGLWSDDQIAPWARIAAFVKAQGAVPGIQLAHAGRKACTKFPWIDGGAQLEETHPDSWQPIGPSAIAFGHNAPRVPRVMSAADIARAKNDFAAAAVRALDAGFEWLELHFGHGYLAQNFLSPFSNARTDEYGGNIAGRARFLIECFAEVRAVWPERLPLAVKLGVTDFHPAGHTLAESIDVIRQLAGQGLDLVDVSLGFNVPDVSGVPWAPGFMVPIAREIRDATHIPVGVGWMMSEPRQADAAIRALDADLVLIARGSLSDPHWPYHAAQQLGHPFPWTTLPPCYADWLKRL